MRSDGRLVGAIALGGAAGALVRSGLEELLPPDPGAWPWTTLVINLAGAALLAAVITTVALGRGSRYRRPLVGTGFCGALTTFSTLQLELLRMLDAGRIGLAAAYAGASVGLGLLVVVAVTRGIRAAAA